MNEAICNEQSKLRKSNDGSDTIFSNEMLHKLMVVEYISYQYSATQFTLISKVT